MIRRRKNTTMKMPTKRYERGCTEYVVKHYDKEISFPKDMVICDLCPFCHTENSGTRFRCLETGEILPFHNVDYGLRCPLFKDQLQRYEPEENEESEEENG
jgi:hypothetical protein